MSVGGWGPSEKRKRKARPIFSASLSVSRFPAQRCLNRILTMKGMYSKKNVRENDFTIFEIKYKYIFGKEYSYTFFFKLYFINIRQLVPGSTY